MNVWTYDRLHENSKAKFGTIDSHMNELFEAMKTFIRSAKNDKKSATELRFDKVDPKYASVNTYLKIDLR